MVNSDPRDQKDIDIDRLDTEGGDFVGKDKIEGDSVGQNKFVGLSGEEVSKIIEVLLKHFPEAYLKRPEQLDQVLKDFQRCHEELREWKELHNYLDTTVQLYDQFGEAVRSIDRQSFGSESLQDLQNGWYKISLKLDQMLGWAKKIQWIGEPFVQTNENKWFGEDWAIKIAQARHDIERHLDTAHKRIEDSNVRPLYRKLFNHDQLDEQWFTQLIEYASRFWSLALSYLHYTDDNLRTTATRLVDISEAALRR